jgi:hypothetical protein
MPASLAGRRRYGTEVADVCIDALAVNFDVASWDTQFSRVWPAGSPAAISYGRRIAEGPRFTIDDALGRLSCTGRTAVA